MMKSIIKTVCLLIVSSASSAENAAEITANNVHNIATAATVKSKISLDEYKPKLENYSNYNDFLHAMYLHNKAQEDDMKPRIVVNLPNTPMTTPEYTSIDYNSDVTTRGEDMSAVKSLADDHH